MRKCCNCCKFAKYEEHSCTIKRSRHEPPRRMLGYILCCKDGQGQYGNVARIWASRCCPAFRYDPLKIVYDVEDDQYYKDWLEAQMSKLSLAGIYTPGYESVLLGPHDLELWGKYYSLYTYYKRFRTLPKKKNPSDNNE